MHVYKHTFMWHQDAQEDVAVKKKKKQNDSDRKITTEESVINMFAQRQTEGADR